jgi:hypothetical protein
MQARKIITDTVETIAHIAFSIAFLLVSVYVLKLISTYL